MVMPSTRIAAVASRRMRIAILPRRFLCPGANGTSSAARAFIPLSGSLSGNDANDRKISSFRFASRRERVGSRRLPGGGKAQVVRPVEKRAGRERGEDLPQAFDPGGGDAPPREAQGGVAGGAPAPGRR